MAPVTRLVAVAALALCCNAFAPGPALPRTTTPTARSAATLSMGYVPDGLTPEQWQAIKARDQQKTEGKDLGGVGVKRFKSRSMFAFMEALEKGEDAHKFPVNLNKVKSGEIAMKDVPYMMRKNGAWDDSDIAKEVPGVQVKKWLQRDEAYANGGEVTARSFNLFGTGLNMPWTGQEAQWRARDAAAAPPTAPPSGTSAPKRPSAAKKA